MSIVGGSAGARSVADNGLACALVVSTKGIFKVIISCFLEQLGVLQALDEFELLSLHALNHLLVLNALLLLPHHLIFNLLLGAHLLLNQLALLLLASLILLTLNHLLKRVVLYVLLLFDDLHEVALLTFLILDCVDLPLDLLLEVTPGHIHVLAVLLLNSAVLRLTEHLFFLLLSLSLHALLLNLHVALSRHQDVVGPLLGLVELLPGLLLLLLEQGDPVREQLVVLLRSLPRHLGCDQLAVQRLVIIIFVNVQVHLVGRRELRTVQLVIQVAVIFLLLVLLLLRRRIYVVRPPSCLLYSFIVMVVPLVFLV